ncbi:MAG: hypothetical protein M9962_12930 [Oligoflexia bacterium]|nr:hypothetical protein [Oligoflexia bacterium]
MKQILLPLIIFSVLATGSSCSRKVENKPLVDAPLVIGPVKKDTDLKLNPKTSKELKEMMSFSGTIPSQDFFRLVENIDEISKFERNDKLHKWSEDLLDAYYASPSNINKVTFANSLFIDALIGEGAPIAEKELRGIAKDIKEGTKKLTALLEKSRSSFPFPKNLKSLDQGIDVADDYVRWLGKEIPKLGLSKEISRPAIGAIQGEYKKYRPSLVELANGLDRAKTLRSAVAAVNKLLVKFKIKLSGEQGRLLGAANEIGGLLEVMQSSQEALTVIIKVWKMVPASERKQVFASVPDIYDFLQDKSDTSLDCLEKGFCGLVNPILEIARNVAILPKISEYGVAKIGAQVNSAGVEYIQASILEEAPNILRDAPLLIRDEVKKEAAGYASMVAQIQKDIPKFIRTRVDAWAKKNLNRSIYAIEAGDIKFKIEKNGKFSISPNLKRIKDFDTNAQTLGTSMSVRSRFIEGSDSQSNQAKILGPILKLFAISGYTQPSGKPFPSLMVSSDGDSKKVFDIKKLLSDTVPYFVPDTAMIHPGYVFDRKKVKLNSSVVSQAELLRGISSQIKLLRDWEKNEFDSALGNVPIEEVIKEIPAGSVGINLFPKDILFALSVGSAGAILQNIILENSPAFLVLSKDELLWGNDYKKIGEGKVSTVAGLVDIVDGKRTNLVHTKDIARFILALDAFLEASEGIENSQSGPLLEKNSEGLTVLEQLVDARKYLRLFMLGLTNFLVDVAKDKKEGGFYSTFDLSLGLARTSDQKDLQTQALAIRAILASSKQLDLEIFHWTALDGYYYLNKKMWDSELQFYKRTDGSENSEKPNLTEISEMIRAGNELSEIMDTDSRNQWTRIARPWHEMLIDL